MMSEFNKNFPVDGTSALRAWDEESARTRIIEFPERACRPRHAKVEDTDDVRVNPLNTFAHVITDHLGESEMVRSLRYGTCAGKAVGKLTSLQAAGASIAFFVFFVGTLLFM